MKRFGVSVFALVLLAAGPISTALAQSKAQLKGTTALPHVRVFEGVG